jgi:predicted component of type VI protein secretion system
MSPGQLTSAIKGCTSSDELLSLVEQHGQTFNQIHCATVLSHAAQLVARHRCAIPRSGIERMVQLAQEQLASMGAQALANSAYALAKLEHKDDVFMVALVEAAAPQLRDFKPQELANTVWALATLGHAGDAFVAALLKVAAPQLCNFKPQELANTAWALATLGHADDAFMAALLKAAKLQLRDYNPQALANTVWALATLGHGDDAFVAALLKVAAPQLRNFNPQNLANTVWALATLGHADDAFVAALLKVAAPQLRDFNPQALANTVWALATLGHADDACVAALLKAAAPQLRDFNPQELSNTAWALAVLDHADDIFMAALLQQAAGMVIPFDSQALIQIFMCMLWLKDQRSDVAAPAQLAGACKRAWMEERDDALPSRVQLEVLAVVRQLPDCSGAASEQATDDGLFSIDIAVQLPDGSRLAVEVDGPYHFLSNSPGRLDGATLLRNRLLEARGWRVVSVPVRTGWDPHAKRGQQAARDYLLSLGVGPV